MTKEIYYPEAIDLPVFKIIAQAAQEQNKKAYVIGGYVRSDFLLKNQKAKDIDVVVLGSGIELAKKVKDLLPPKTKSAYYKNFGTAMLQSGDLELEFVGARKESYRKDSRKPIVEEGSMEDDQNAGFYP